MKKLFGSYTLFRQWEMGARDEVMARIWGTHYEPTERMQAGQDLHTLAAENKLKALPFINDSWLWESDKDNYYTHDLHDWLQLRCKIDLWDGKTIILDWKTGTKHSWEHDTKQIWFYAWMLKQKGFDIKEGYIVKLSKDLKVEGVTRILITPEKLVAIENWIETIATDIFSMANES